MHRAISKLRTALRGRTRERELEREIAIHLEHLADEHMRGGMSQSEAWARARRDFGGVDQMKARYRDETGFKGFADMAQDVRFAVRALGRAPRFTTIAVLTLALGIGATTAIFSVTHAVLLEPLPYRDADRIVMVWETLRSPRGSASAGHFSDWTEQNRVFDGTAAMQRATYTLADDGEPERVNGTRVTSGFFDVVHIPPALGRYIEARDVEAGGRVVVLSDGLWRSRYRSDRSIVGREIRLSGAAHTVIGVAPPQYALIPPDRGSLAAALGPQLWTPLVFSPEQRANFGNHSFPVIARLAPGVSRVAAQADLERVTRGIAERHPENMAGRGVHVEPVREVLLGTVRPQLVILLTAIGLVMLSGCVNVSGLLLVRAGTRRIEMATRTALGGGRWRLARQLLTESVVLALVSGAAALVVARLGVAFLVRSVPPNVPRLTESRLQPEVLGFALLVTLASALLFGVWPAFRASLADVQGAVHGAGNSAVGGGRRERVSALVTAEIAIAIVLLVAAGLFVRSAMRLDAVPLGYRPDAVLTARVTLPAERYADPEVVADAYRRMLVELRATAGVDSAGASTNLPLGGNSIDASLTVDGRDPPPGEPRPSGHVRVVTDEYLETIGVRRVQGRLLEPSDMRPGAPAVVVINERLAGILWPDGDPIGQRLSGWTAGPAPEWREVVGVVADARTFGPDEPLEPELFVPYTQAPSRSWDAFERSLALAVRGPGTAATHAAALRRAVRTVDPSLPLYELRTMDAMVADSTAPERFRMRLFGLIAAIAILLAAVGVYGVIAYYVTLRTREIGIRVALGARRGDVLRMVVRRALAMTGLGVAAGLLGAAAVTRYLENLLFEVTPLDPATFAGVAVVFTAIAVLASYLPARRAARLEPLRALRHE